MVVWSLSGGLVSLKQLIIRPAYKKKHFELQLKDDSVSALRQFFLKIVTSNKVTRVERVLHGELETNK